LNPAQVRTLVDYHYWALDRLFDAVERLTPEQLNQTIESSFPSVRQTLVHLHGAEWVWVSRWIGEAPTAFPDGGALTDLPAIRNAWMVERERLRALLDRLDEAGISQPMEYRCFDGRSYSQPLWEMLQHVVNHGSYHRGQITMMLRQLGVPPAKQMDLIAFHRELAGASGVTQRSSIPPAAPADSRRLPTDGRPDLRSIRRSRHRRYPPPA
jgi:uncharacterized damage-inducible protein DinB